MQRHTPGNTENPWPPQLDCSLRTRVETFARAVEMPLLTAAWWRRVWAEGDAGGVLGLRVAWGLRDRIKVTVEFGARCGQALSETPQARCVWIRIHFFWLLAVQKIFAVAKFVFLFFYSQLWYFVEDQGARFKKLGFELPSFLHFFFFCGFPRRLIQGHSQLLNPNFTLMSWMLCDSEVSFV